MSDTISGMKYFICFFIFLLSFQIVSAQVVISEIQILPTNERFVELQNTSGSDVDLTGWYIQRKTATGKNFNSLVTKTDFEGKAIAAGEYFLISRGALADSDIIKEKLTLTESNTLRIRNSSGEDVDQVEFGSIKEGESYQRTSSGNWIVAIPTPNSINLEEGPPNNGNRQKTFNNNVVSPNSPSVVAADDSWPVEQQIFARIKNAPHTAVAGADVLFEGETLGFAKKPLKGARYLWTFGDGGTKEGKKILYNYNYPGKYVVILNASSGKYSASDRVILEIIPADILISSVGTDTDSFIEVYNKTKYELDLSWWRLRAGSKFFTIPKNTIILPKSKIIFPTQHTEFEIKKEDNIELLYPNGALVFSYTWKPNLPLQESTQTAVSKTQLITKKKQTPKNNPAKVKPLQVNEKEDETIVLGISGEKQTADIFSVGTEDEGGIYKWLLAVAGLSILSVGGLLFSRKTAGVPQLISPEAKKYKIIEE
jgi:hypothetical protein